MQLSLILMSAIAVATGIFGESVSCVVAMILMKL